MLHKAKYLLLGTTLFTFSTLAFADNSGFSPSPDFYVGLQMGYADTNWDWVMDTDDSGLAGSVLVGYELNQYFSIETGYVILPQSTYDVNFLGKLRVPVTDRLGLFAKAGPSYLWSTDGILDEDVHTWNIAYGLGAELKLRTNLAADVTYMKFEGHPYGDINEYIPDVDYYAVGVSYKFSI